MIIVESEPSDTKSVTERAVESEAPGSPPPYAPSSPDSSKPLPTTPGGDSPLPTDLPPRCNHLIEHKRDNSVKGVWHIDTALIIPDSLLAPLEDFDGLWNEAESKGKKDKGKKKVNEGVRPNLMLKSKNGSVTGEVHIVSSDEIVRPAVVVAEGHNGSVTLEVRDYSQHQLRIFATSKNGSVRVRIPRSFEGAITVSTHNGSTNISDVVKSRMTTFSGASNTTRGFVGDWQAVNFGAEPEPSAPTQEDPDADPPLPTISADPFTTWTGPLVHIASHNGSVHLAYVDEPKGGPGPFSRFMSGLFGGDADGGRGGPSWRGGGGPFGRGGGPFGPGSGPFGRGGSPFGRGGGPFGRGGGPFGHSHGSCGHRGRWGSCGSRSEHGGHGFEPGEVDENGYPVDKKRDV